MYYPELTNAEGKCLIDCIIKAKHPTTDNISDLTDEESEMYDSLMDKIEKSKDTILKTYMMTVHLRLGTVQRDFGIVTYGKNIQDAVKITEAIFANVSEEVTITAIRESKIEAGCIVLTDDSTLPKLFTNSNELTASMR